MFTRLLKIIALAAFPLLMWFSWRNPATSFTIVVGGLIWAAALAILAQSVSRRNTPWVIAAVFLTVAYNPIFPILLGRGPLLAMNLFSAALVAASLYFLPHTPRMSLESITGAPSSRAL